jgi:DNA-binding NtrC family response regulator
MKGKVLIIDDEQSFRETMARLLRKRGLSCLTAGEGREGINLALKEHPDIIFCDIVMPGTDGISVLDELSRRYPQGAVVMITAHGTMETAIEALRKGAHDYLLKPIHLENLLKKIQTVLERKALMQEVGALRRELSRGVGIFEIVGESPRIREVVELTKKVSATRTPVLIRGETGTGKELVARAIHLQGDPPGKRFVAINCAAIPEQLLESELFGHMKGAFTGAVEAREGYFELADGGTLFLDEISEMPPGLQAKLLRATERKEILRIGGKNPLLVDVRIVSSTNRDLKQLAEEGRFRKDLLYRIQVMEIYLPPLRERREDIPLLLEYFVRRLSA